MSRVKDTRELRRVAERLGWRFAGLTARGHSKWQAPDGRLAVTSSDLSGFRSWQNAVRTLRRPGDKK